jgi:ABC-type transporter lipoprotein component MlaA
VLDAVFDPVSYVAPTGAVYALYGVSGLDIVNDRYELDTVLDELLYNSTDSYSAQRIAYLQNMRARLEGGTGIEQLEDVYEDY